MSIRTRSGSWSRTTARPISASVAPSTTCPADSSTNVADRRLAALSSRTRTLVISHPRVAARQGAPDFRGETVDVKRGFLHDRQDVAIETVAIRVGDLHRGDYNNGDGRRAGMLVERRHNVEAADFRHHQIEHDEVRLLPTRDPDGLTPTI